MAEIRLISLGVMKIIWEATFATGDIIEFCSEQFEVVVNNGYSGTVKEFFGEGKYGDTVSNFKWEFQGERCKLIKPV
ncbi:hypothetical protein GCM10023310_69930 [Paenibacillus vulneris]|uniref:DUF2187 domain-containing protein n=1 Tax=Paenibacillus vulneris TaxID=1133364 RepID=A0ABW3UGW8_9BACL